MAWEPFRFGASCARQTLEMVRADKPVYAAVLIFTFAGLLLLEVVGGREFGAHALYFRQWTTMFLFLMPVIALSIEALYVIHRFDRRRALAFSRVYSSHRFACLLSGMALLMGLMIFQGTFTSIKNVLPLMQGGFPHDRLQADIDAMLHFGVDPWRLLYAFGDSDLMRRALEWNYNVLWFLLCFGSLFFVATAPQARAIRLRYMAMFMLVWIICGNLLAGLFLSAGPAFYGAVTGDYDRFAALLTFLAGSGHAFSSAHSFQTYLWNMYESGRSGFGSGISAFPSVHVALITMNAFFLFDFSRRLGAIAFVYVILIVASSVYLGWHYAIDGYVSLVVVAGLHLACKRWLSDDAVASPASVDVGERPESVVPAGVRAS